MAGDPVRDAIRTRLGTVLPVGFPYLETINNATPAPVGTNWATLTFAGGTDEQASFGAPGANWFLGRATAVVDLFAKPGKGHEAVELAAKAVIDGFRGQRLTTADNRSVRILDASAAGAGEDETAAWVESVNLFYEVWTVA